MMLALALAAAGMGADNLFASSITIPQLQQACADSAKDPLLPNLCTGYILGTLDAMASYGEVCPTSTKGLTVRALEIGRQTLADYTGQSDRPPARLIGDALKKAYPCGTPA